jgi:hypothetical protein
VGVEIKGNDIGEVCGTHEGKQKCRVLFDLKYEDTKSTDNSVRIYPKTRDLPGEPEDLNLKQHR